MALREIDTRIIPGNGGEVVLSACDTYWAPETAYLVSVYGPDGQEVCPPVECKTTQEARDAFLHTFARPDVPDVFACVKGGHYEAVA